MAQEICTDYNRFGNTTGEVVLDTVDKRNNKMVSSPPYFPLDIQESTIHWASDEWRT